MASVLKRGGVWYASGPTRPASSGASLSKPSPRLRRRRSPTSWRSRLAGVAASCSGPATAFRRGRRT